MTATTKAELPTAWARIRAFDLGLRARVARRAPTRHGFALRFREPLLWDLNFVYVERAHAPTAELVADAEAVLDGLGHRMLVVDEPGDGARLAAELRPAGWTVERHVAMVAGVVPPQRRRPRQPAREVSPGELLVARRRAMRELGDSEQTVAAIETADAALGAAGRERGFASFAGDGTVAAFAKLYGDDDVGQIEDVQTLLAHRGAGHAQAALLAALDGSSAAGHELTFLWADEDDWPRELYGRLGFSVAGRRWRLRRAV